MSGDSASSEGGILRRAWDWFIDRLTVDWDELEEAEENCPNCKSDDYWKEPGKIGPDVHRCRNCGAEGVKLR